MNETVDNIITAIINILWYGVWIYIIFWLHYSGWWILIPILFHWTTNKQGELESKKEDENTE
jgi:hypothetical protein